MRGYNFTSRAAFGMTAPLIEQYLLAGDEFFIICAQTDIEKLMGIFGWDEDTVQECTNLDETVRFTSYNGYDFLSLICVTFEDGAFCQYEINLFISKRYLVFVLQTPSCASLEKTSRALDAAAAAANARPAPLLYLYYFILDAYATDFSAVLEDLENEIEALSEKIEASTRKEQGAHITRIRKTAYTYKKIIRAASNIGAQILIDDNDMLDEYYERYFRSIDARFVKLYGFSDNLFDLSHSLANLFDSKLAAQTNETVNKLTVVTVLFAPMTVIVGVYGMNFANMPELNWRYGYPFSILLMAAVSVVILFVLRKKGWF